MKRLRKFLALLLVAVMIAALPGTAWAGGETVNVAMSGNCGVDGDNVTWSLDSDGVLTICGQGEMQDCTQNTPWDAPAYGMTIKAIHIENGVTSIGNRAFLAFHYLTDITIPNTVTSIGDSAFNSCHGLTSITIPDSVTSIGEYTFIYCDSLTSITIPDSVTSIGNSAFQSCSGLTSANISEGVTNIDDYTFYDCSSLTNITIPDSVTSIGNFVFYNCNSLADVYYSGTKAQWEQITIENYYGENGNAPLLNSTIHCTDGIINPKEESNKCGDDLTWTLEDGTLTISGTGEMYDYKDSSAPWFERRSEIKTVVMPDGLTSIGGAAFWGCSGLTGVSIPDGVTTIGEGAFSDCSSLTSVSIPGGVTSIGKGAFLNCKGLTSVSIPTNISSIEESTFFGCSSLSSISIPTSVISIGEKAFTLCSTLKDVYYGGTKAQWEQINISNDYNDPLLNATIHYSKNSATYEILQHIGTADTEDPTRYIVTGESNEIWIIKAPLEQFQNLYIDGEKLTSGTDYTATAAYDSTKTRSTVITIENVVLASPGGGNHTLAAEFRGEYACTVIDVSQAVLEKLAPGLHTIAAEFLPSANSEVRRVAQNFTIESARTLLEAGVRYVPYSWKPEVAGGPYSVAAGTLPNGMSVDRETGEIAGIPMVPGTWKFTVGNGDTETLYTLVIADNSNTAVQQPNDYEITTPVGTLSGSDFILYAYTDRTMVIDGPYNEFMELYIDGRKLTRDVEYEAHEGSTVLTIYAQTFEKTGKGTHTISAEFRENGDPNGKLKTVSQNYTVSISQPSSNNSSSNKKKPSSSTKPSTNTAPAVPETPEVPEVPAGLRFGDVSAANWFYEDVKWAYEGGIMNGATANAFAPNRDISQATIVTVLARLGQIDLTRFETVSDSTIESGKWYTTAAIWAKQSGILPDYSAFTGEETISRDQMAIMLVKYLRSMGKDTTPPAQSAVFADADMMSQDGNNAFQVLYHYNIFRGVGEGRMDPAGSTTRAQFAALAHRLSDAAAN